MCTLSKILSTIPIQGLALKYSNFLMGRPERLLKAINETPHLVFLKCSDSTNSEIIMSEITENRSLLSADLFDWNCSAKCKDSLRGMLARNAGVCLQPEYAATTAARFLTLATSDIDIVCQVPAQTTQDYRF